MANVKELDELIEAIEGGSYQNTDFDVFDDPEEYTNAIKAYNGSIDAAMALHKALLGEAHWSIAEDDDYGFCGRVYLGGWFHEHSTVAARAWLIAVLKAYRELDQ